MSIFEKLNLLLLEAEESKNTKKPIPVHPEMTTKEQGKMAAAEKILKLFQKLSIGGNGTENFNNGIPQIPDDLIDPMFKNPPKASKDKNFDKNKLTGWDDEVDDNDKIKKEVDVNDDQNKDDDFDDFDYRNNEFGDEEDDSQDQNDDNRSEEDKLKDSIKDAIDSLNGNNNEQSGGEGDDSGANWGDDSEESGGQQRQQQQRNAKAKRLEDLKNALDSEDMKSFKDNLEDVKNITDTPDTDNNTQPGGKMDIPTDDSVKEDMRKAGLDKESIDKIIKEKNIDTSKDYTEEELEELEQQVIDGLEKRCKGKSSLADTITSAAADRKITNDDWKELLKIFLDKKSKNKGRVSSTNDEIKFGNKNSLWRKAILPTIDAPSTGDIQTINCFVDFSGSVNKNLVFHFLGEVINLCVSLKYSAINVYGFSDNLSVPRKLDYKTIMEDAKNLKDGIQTAISETWEFLHAQNLGSAEQFKNVAEEINKIKRKEPESVFLIFGDAEWLSIKNLKDYINRVRYFKDICILAYYIKKPGHLFIQTIKLIRNYVGIEHLITSRADSIT